MNVGGPLFHRFALAAALLMIAFFAGSRESAALREKEDRIFQNLRERMITAEEYDSIPVIIRYKSGVEPTGRNIKIRKTFRLIPAVSASLTKAEILKASDNPAIDHIELDAEIKIAMDGARLSTGVQQIKTQFGFDGNRDAPRNYTANDIVIAIIDTGINARHPDLRGKVLFWNDYISERRQPYDDEGHGTAVAAVAAGTGTSNPAYTGVAPGAALVVLKVLDSGGSGLLSDGISAVEDVILMKSEFNIRVLNLSFATSGSSDGRDALSEVCNRAVANGIVVVAAAGNEGPSLRTIGSPAAAASIITVGAGADLGAGGFYLADFSSRGPTADGRIKPDLWAPGVFIRTAKRQGGYANFSGTSLATPFVSGVVALMFDANPLLTPRRVKSILTATSVRWMPGGRSNEAGFGRLQAYQAITQSAAITANLKPPETPRLRRLRGTIGARQEQFIDLPVGSTKFPVAITCIVLKHPTADVDLELLSPSGNVLQRSSEFSRQETLRFFPAAPGHYRIRLISRRNSTQFLLSISGDLL